MQPLLVAFAGATFTDFEGAPAELDASDPLENFLANAGLYGVALMRPGKETTSATLKALRSLQDAVSRAPDLVATRTEPTSVHRRFPYSVLAAFFLLDKGAENDNVREGQPGLRRRSTFLNAHARLRLFTGRDDPAGRDEQFERFYIMLADAAADATSLRAYEVGKPDVALPIDLILDELLALVAERNPDFYEFDDLTMKIVRLPN